MAHFFFKKKKSIKLSREWLRRIIIVDLLTIIKDHFYASIGVFLVYNKYCLPTTTLQPLKDSIRMLGQLFLCRTENTFLSRLESYSCKIREVFFRENIVSGEQWKLTYCYLPNFSLHCWPRRLARLLPAGLYNLDDLVPLLAAEQAQREEARRQLDKLLQTCTFKPHSKSILNSELKRRHTERDNCWKLQFSSSNGNLNS